MRIAPSLISRSECELFSTSAPRFAVRMELPDGSFINLRRLSFLAKTCENIDWLSPPPSTVAGLRLGQVVRQNLAQPGRCIADSVLAPPRHRYGDDQWYTLTAPLGRAYGECGWAEKREIQGTPFVRQILLGGGMCAQAACFMATALLHEHAVGVHGVSEITALADSDVTDGRATELQIGGMGVEGVSRYFEGDSVRLSAPAISLPLSIAAKLRLGLQQREMYLGQAIRSYVLSGFPVIQSLDMLRLIRAREYQPLLASLRKPPPASTDEELPHAVVVVGASLDPGGEFLINDPDYLPFRRVSKEELQAAVQIGQDEMSNRPLMPITPIEVQLPLFTPTATSDGARSDRRGLDYLLSVPSGRMLFDDPLLQAHLCDTDPNDEFRLFNVQSEGDNWLRTLCRGDSIDASAISLFDAWLAGADGDSLSWIWSRHRRHPGSEQYSESIVFCDATRRIPVERSQTCGPRRNLLLCALLKDRRDDTWRVTRIGRSNLRPSAITSYTSSSSPGVKYSLSRQDVEPHVESLEWYSFMQTEVDGTGRRARATSDRVRFVSVLEYLAGYQRLGEGALDAVLDGLASDVDAARGDRPIIALATFIPPLSLPVDTTGAGLGRDALIFVAKFADRLARRQDFQASARRMIIELVAGSRVAGLKAVAEREFKASFLSQTDSVAHFVQNLEIIVEATKDLPVTWAVELEPGPLFTIRDWQSVCDLCARLDQSCLLSPSVGLNLDISHWRMAVAHRRQEAVQRISPRLVRETPSVFRRIVHAHISGHHERAHFGDIPLDVLNTSDEFRPWISLLRERAACTDVHPAFSGYVSLEFEAAKNEVVAIAAMREFAMMLARLNPAF
ncbi:MAG: hypothetical protein RIC55_03685 [Pirellulaceae bacterium]